MKIYRILMLLSAAALIYACSPRTGAVLYTPAVTDATDSVSYEQLVEGRKLYVAKCAGCHNLKLPQSRTEAEWHKAMIKMQPKAKISDAERDLILQFVLRKAKPLAQK